MSLSMRHLVPLGSETRWSDLLAVLVEADPASVVELLGLPMRGAAVTVEREVVPDRSAVTDGGVRADLLVQADGAPTTLI